MRSSTTIGVLAVAMLTAGCGGRASMAQWQSSVEQYVTQHGGGDLNQLRSEGAQAERPVLRVIGADDPDWSHDVGGLLLGRRVADGRPWYVFLVAVVEKQQIAQIRPAAVSGQPPHYDWLVGEHDPQAFERYMQSVRPFDGLSADPLARWKSGADAFELDAGAQVLTVRHPRSGAAWELHAARPPAPPTADAR